MQTVEFLGFPGAGKTTLVRYLACELNDVVLRAEFLRVATQGDILMHPVLHLRPAMRNPSVVARGPVARNAVKSYAKQHSARRRHSGPGTVILEEGFVHHLWRAVFCGLPMRNALRMIRDATKGADLFIYLEVAQSTAATRIARKANPGPINRTLMDHAPGGSVWTEGQCRYQSLAREIARCGGEVRTVDATQGLEVVSENVLAILRNQ